MSRNIPIIWPLPYVVGIQKHIALAALGVPIGLYAERKVDERSARRDAALIQYIKLHPESFPETGKIVTNILKLTDIPIQHVSQH